jgi:hypothetical protein
MGIALDMDREPDVNMEELREWPGTTCAGERKVLVELGFGLLKVKENTSIGLREAELCAPEAVVAVGMGILAERWCREGGWCAMLLSTPLLDDQTKVNKCSAQKEEVLKAK